MKKILFAISTALVLFAGCRKTDITVSEGLGSVNFTLESDGDGYRTKVAALEDPDVSTFGIRIESTDGSYSREWDSFAEVPSVLELVSGTYTVTAFSPAQEKVAWDQPVYGGSKEFAVVVNKVSNVNIVCSITNMMVSLNPTEDFLKELTDWEVVVKSSDGSLSWTDEEYSADSDKAAFFAVAPLTVIVSGTRYSGEAVDQRMISIDDVAARDHHIINLDANVTGESGFDLTVDNTLNDRNQNITVPGFEEIPVPGGDDSGETGPDEGDDEPQPSTAPILEWPANSGFETMEIAAEMSVDLVIKAPEKIKSVIVRVSENFADAIKVITTDGSDYLDLVNVNISEAMVPTLQDGGLPLGEELLDKETVNLSLSALVPMIGAVGTPGDDYVFTLEVTDGKGQNLEKSLTFHNPETQE